MLTNISSASLTLNLVLGLVGPPRSMATSHMLLFAEFIRTHNEKYDDEKKKKKQMCRNE